MADYGGNAANNFHVVERSQQLQVAPPDWQPIAAEQDSLEPIAAEEESGAPRGVGADKTATTGLWNRVGLYVVGKNKIVTCKIYT